MHYSAVFEYIATTICFLLVTHITNSATILLLLLLLVWFLIIGNYTARGERLKTVALILMRVLLLLWPHRSIDLECYQLFACLLFCVCLWMWVLVWRLFGLVGSIIRICYHHHSLPLPCFCLFWCYYSIIVISFQLLLLNIVCDAWFRVSVVYAWECIWAFFCYLLHVFFIVSFTIIFFFPLILPLNYFTKFRVYIVEPNIMLNTINWDEKGKEKGGGCGGVKRQ